MDPLDPTSKKIDLVDSKIKDKEVVQHDHRINLHNILS